MAKDKKPLTIQLPRDALSRIRLGHSFAECDIIRDAPGLFVQTQSTAAAVEYGEQRSKCFFIGRRGTGKTALTYFIKSRIKNTIDINPLLNAPLGIPVNIAEFTKFNQPPFRTLIASYKRALMDEVLLTWVETKRVQESKLVRQLAKELNNDDRKDFELRLLEAFKVGLEALQGNEQDIWLREIKREKTVVKEMAKLCDDSSWHYTLLIDRIDELWDGTDEAVVFLMALMHACVELSSACAFVRPLLFLRENIFDRVRKLDNEFARLETWTVSLGWSEPYLVEMIERRLNHPFTAKLPLGGTTWDYFFEQVDGKSSREYVFAFCQDRPRDVLTFCEFAIATAVDARRQRVTFDDLKLARQRFSENRLKDLGDEYAENFPIIQLVLNSFFGLGIEFTLAGLEAFIKKLIVEPRIVSACGTWLFHHHAPERFAELLWNIGFLGIGNGSVVFRSPGANDAAHPPITSAARFVVHGTYRAACYYTTKLSRLLRRNTRSNRVVSLTNCRTRYRQTVIGPPCKRWPTNSKRFRQARRMPMILRTL
jgi:hypothetical protein